MYKKDRQNLKKYIYFDTYQFKIKFVSDLNFALSKDR